MHKLADILDLPADVQEKLSKPTHALGYRGVSQSQMSLARHYGGILINGQHYTYFPASDELIRYDVLKAIAQHKRQMAALEQMAADAQQLGLGY